MKTICVFCGSSNDVKNSFKTEASKLGKLIGSKSWNLVHGGGIIGLMGELLEAAADNGASITGVVPEYLNKPNIVNSLKQNLIVTKDMKDRKEYMRNKSDAFIALPGGFGTLEEIMEVITLKQLKYHQKPIVIINTDNYYKNFLCFLDDIYKQNFANISYKKLYFFADNSEQAIEYLNTYKYSNIYDKYLRE